MVRLETAVFTLYVISSNNNIEVYITWALCPCPDLCIILLYSAATTVVCNATKNNHDQIDLLCITGTLLQPTKYYEVDMYSIRYITTNSCTIENKPLATQNLATQNLATQTTQNEPFLMFPAQHDTVLHRLQSLPASKAKIFSSQNCTLASTIKCHYQSSVVSLLKQNTKQLAIQMHRF